MATKSIQITKTSEVVQSGSVYEISYLLEELDEFDAVVESESGTLTIQAFSTLAQVDMLLDAKADIFARRNVWKDEINADINNPRTEDIEVPDPEV